MKKNSLYFHLFNIFAVIVFLIALASCTPAKNVVYFQNVPQNVTIPALVDNNLELKIRKNDLINISIISPDPVTTPLFNGIPGSSSSGTSSTPSSAVNGGHLVDNKGNITIYKLGVIQVEGLTRNELKQKLQKDLSPYLKDVVVNVTFLNNRVTILGEVSKPQVLTMTTEQLTLLEAFGMAGDILISGRKDNILLIRETPTGKEFKRLNLTDNSIFNSGYFKLRPDDVVYVEPTEVKIKNSGNAPQTIGYLLTGISIALTLILNLLR